MRQPISRPCGHDTPETNPERHELLTEQRDLSRSRATQVYKRAARSMPSYQSPSCPLPSRPVTTLAYAGAHAHLDAVACLLTLARCALRTSWPAELVRTSHVTFISGMRGYLDAFPNTDTLSMSTEKKKSSRKCGAPLPWAQRAHLSILPGQPSTQPPLSSGTRDLERTNSELS